MAVDQITADLAVVARASRERPVLLEDTLRAVGALAPAPRVVSGRVDFALVAMARLFGVRVARITASAVMLAAVVAILAYTAVPLDSWDDWGAIERVLYEGATELVVTLLLATGLVYLAALHLALMRFQREVGVAPNMRARGQQLVERVDGWAIALTIGAVTGFLVVFRMSRLVVGDAGLSGTLDVLDDPAWIPLDPMWTLVPLAATLLAGVGGGVAIARYRHLRWAIRGWTVLVASAGVLAALVASIYYDVELVAMSRVPAHVIGSPALRAALLVASGLATFTLVASYVLARRRREHAEIDGGDPR